MTEGDIKTALMNVLRVQLPAPRWVLIRHEDQYTFGVPDLSITGGGWTSWWEVKHAAPRLTSNKGIQQRLATKLEHAGYCRYLIYREETRVSNRAMVIVKPSELSTWSETYEQVFLGWDHARFARYIHTLHHSVKKGESPR